MKVDAGLRATVDAQGCVFTIVSRNYFHFALNLMASVAEHLPGARRVVVVCDAVEGLPQTDGIELVAIDELPIGPLDRMVHHYTILELNTAIKPFAFQKLFAGGAPWVVYFDPDIQLYSSGAPLLARLDSADAVLTPHLTAPLRDDRHPSDLSILQSGTYNLGFLALRRSPAADELLEWWGGKLERDCVVDIPRGLFTDQKWIDLVPGFFDRVAIVRDAGWNVAYWNLAHRKVERGEAGCTVNGRPLFFFHFSGRDPRSASISKHQDRFTLDRCTPAVRELFADYESRLLAHGRDRFAALPYAFATLADGTPLPDVARRVLRRGLDDARRWPDLRSREGAQALIEFLLAPVDSQKPPLSRLALQLYEARDDLRAAFPDVRGAHRQAYLDWYAERAGAEAGIVGALAQPAPTAPSLPPFGPAEASAMPAAPAAVPVSATGSHAAKPAATLPVGHWPYRMAYRVAWNARHLLRPLVPPAVRQRARAALVRRAYPPVAPVAPVAPAAASAPAASGLPFGVTVIGYVRAESGVGESARSTLRALAATAVPHAYTDFRVGNVSRMDETVDDRFVQGVRHAVSLFHVNADQMPVARAHLDPAWFAVRRRIGFWAWELERFPTAWHGAFEQVDEVWVPSSFCQAAVAVAAPVPVLCMPHCVEIPVRLESDRARFGLREGSVVFLAMADMMSIAARKNPLGAVRAFVQAFGPDDRRAELVVKVSNPERDPEAFDALRAMAASHPGIRLIGDYLDRATLNTLLDSVDVYVSLHRSEGFGLGIAEAMARGKVALATGWSGNMDYMGAHNALPVDFDLVTLAADAGPYARGERWAEPSLTDAAAKMRLMVEDRALREHLGRRARADCERQLSPQALGARIGARLQVLREQLG